MLIRYGAALAIRCVFCIVLSVSTTIAAECQKDNFGTWLEHFKQEAIGVGISQQTVATALNGITYNPAISCAIIRNACSSRALSSFPAAWFRPTACARAQIC